MLFWVKFFCLSRSLVLNMWCAVDCVLDIEHAITHIRMSRYIILTIMNYVFEIKAIIDIKVVFCGCKLNEKKANKNDFMRFRKGQANKFYMELVDSTRHCSGLTF